jgi:hypothetical protein
VICRRDAETAEKNSGNRFNAERTEKSREHRERKGRIRSTADSGFDNSIARWIRECEGDGGGVIGCIIGEGGNFLGVRIYAGWDSAGRLVVALA